ncbi:MAG: GNAT family N-acetyltransferase [Rubricella sp.]
MTTCPVIETERLTLRPHRLEDFEAFRAFYASDRARYVGGEISLTRLWYGFCAEVAYWKLQGFGMWAVDRREDGAFIGQVGLQHPPFFAERELGWILFEGFEGHGYALEAASAARDYAFETLGWDTFVSYIDGENERSIALAKRLGAVLDPAGKTHHPDDVVYRHRREAVAA